VFRPAPPRDVGDDGRERLPRNPSRPNNCNTPLKCVSKVEIVYMHIMTTILKYCASHAAGCRTVVGIIHFLFPLS